MKSTNPVAINLSSVADNTKRTIGSITTVGKKEPTAPSNEAGQQHAESAEWYKPDLGEIPYAPLTKEKRMKIEARDMEIAEKERELEEILQNINARK